MGWRDTRRGTLSVGNAGVAGQARVLLESGQAPRACLLLEGAAQRSPKDAEIAYVLAQALQERGRYEEAIETYQRLLDIVPDFAEGHASVAECLRAQKSDALALVHSERAVEPRPDSSLLRDALGTALGAAGRLQEALLQHEAAVRLEPTNAVYAGNLGATLGRMGRWSEAVVWLARATDLDPLHLTALQNLGEALASQARWDAAAEAFERRLGAGPEGAEVHAWLAECRSELEQVESAIGHYQRAHALAPDNPEYTGRLARALAVGGRGDEGLLLLREYPSGDPVIECWRALTELAADLPEEALASCERARQVAPRLALPLVTLGRVREYLGDARGADDAFRAAAEVDPSGSDLLLELSKPLAEPG